MLLRAGAAQAAAIVLVAASAASVSAIDATLDVRVDSWAAGGGRAYVAVKADGRWARPGSRQCSSYFSRWDHRTTIFTDPVRDQWAATVYTCTGSAVNPLSPTMVITSRLQPGIGVRRATSGVLSLDLGVAVAPRSAPALTDRTITAGLAGNWLARVGDHISASIVPGSITIRRWTVDFGDGTSSSFAPSPSSPTRLEATHAYGPGEFEVTVTARVTGRAYAAFFAPDGTPYETTIAWAVDITNAAAGVAGLPIEYVEPVVTTAASPSGSLPGGTAAAPDPAGHTEFWWPRGLPCDLFVRAIVEREGFMRSGGVTIGGGQTRLVSYRYGRGVNDAAGATRSGRYRAAAPIRIQWDRPLPGTRTYPVELTLTVETTYDDGTVRESDVSGVVEVTVVYSATAH